MLPHGRLPSNSCIGRAPPDFPSPPAHLLRGPSDTALAFLDQEEASKGFLDYFRIADQPGVIARRPKTSNTQVPVSWTDGHSDRH
jgi:hypothetical protein